MKPSILSHSYKKGRRRSIKHLLCFFFMLILCSACSNTKANSPTSISIFGQQPDATAQQAPIASQEYSVYTERDGIMGRFDAQQTDNNPYEHTISTQNLSQLHPIWSYRTGHPLGMVSANGMVYIGYAQNVDALAEKTGKVLWQYQASGDTILATNQSPLVVVNETVYVALSEKVCALDARNGQQRWCALIDPTNPKESLIGSELIYADHILYFTASQTLIALDAHTGRRVWSYVGALGHILVANGIVYSGGILALDAHSGEFRWSFPLLPQDDDSAFSSPVIANGVLYLPEKHVLYALDTRTGRLLWSTELLGEPASDPAVANGLLYLVLAEQGKTGVQLQAFNLTTHSMVWSRPFDGQDSLASPVIANDVLYVSTLRNGDSPIVPGGDFGSTAMGMYGIDSQTGQLLRTFQDNDQVFQVRHILVANGHVYVFGDNTSANWTKPDVFALGLA